ELPDLQPRRGLVPRRGRRRDGSRDRRPDRGDELVPLGEHQTQHQTGEQDARRGLAAMPHQYRPKTVCLVPSAPYSTRNGSCFGPLSPMTMRSRPCAFITSTGALWGPTVRKIWTTCSFSSLRTRLALLSP